MLTTFEALTPIFLMIVAGRLLGALAFPSADFWDRAATLTYWVLLPALLFRATARSELASADLASISLVVIIPIIAVFILLALFRRISGLPFALDAAFVQSCVRQNSYVALAASLALWGETALTALALVLAIYVPFVNVASSWLLTRRHASSPAGGTPAKRQLSAIATNPLILACLAGIGFARTGLTLPLVVDHSLEIAGRAALPLALLAIGSSLRADLLRDRAGWLVFANAIKLLVFPLVSLVLALALGLGPIELAVTVLVAAMPTAASAYPLTRELGGDADFVASAITMQTVLATLSVPLVVLLIDLVSAGPAG